MPSRHFPAAFFAISLCAVTPGAIADVAITGVRVNGKNVSVAAAPSDGREREVLQIPPAPRTVQFLFNADSKDPAKPARLMFKLEGFDAGWREATGQMRFVIRFLDAANNILAASEVVSTHQSPGWRGSIDASAFTLRRAEAVAPERAAKVQFWCVSGGPESTTGIMAIRKVVLRIVPRDGSPPRLFHFDAETGADLDQSLGVPANWARDGSRPEMAQILRIDAPAPQHLLTLVDHDRAAFGAWVTPGSKRPAIAPGDRVEAEWEDCYTVGRLGFGGLDYPELPPGNYWFRLRLLGPADEALGSEASLPILVRAPFWQRAWFWMLIGGVVAAGVAGIVRRTTQQRMQRELERVQQQHLLERERARIARDIHDDLGATLAQIAMLSELAEADAGKSTAVGTQLNEIFAHAHDATRKLDEIVWAINPANDTVEHLAAYLCKFAQDYLALARIRCRLDVPESLPGHALTSAQRHHLFLAAREALHNAVKHGAPSEAVIRIAAPDGELVVSIEDNGCGFEAQSQAASPRGTANMRQRMEQVGGRFDRRSTPGAGTIVTLTLPLSAPIPNPS